MRAAFVRACCVLVVCVCVLVCVFVCVFVWARARAFASVHSLCVCLHLCVRKYFCLGAHMRGSDQWIHLCSTSISTLHLLQTKQTFHHHCQQLMPESSLLELLKGVE
jgi:hypothetical protein